eukprot:SM000007S20904  [mRNA]  locus=s7:824581:825796:+ [translate_table: standard]
MDIPAYMVLKGRAAALIDLPLPREQQPLHLIDCTGVRNKAHTSILRQLLTIFTQVSTNNHFTRDAFSCRLLCQS